MFIYKIDIQSGNYLYIITTYPTSNLSCAEPNANEVKQRTFDPDINYRILTSSTKAYNLHRGCN
jgi:hypothetical protein